MRPNEPTPPTGIKVYAGELHRVRKGRARVFVTAAPSGPRRAPARVAVMLALAHQIRNAIDRSEIRDQAEAARRLGLTRARLTQLLDLTLLAPDVQESVLHLEAIDASEPLSERALRPVTCRQEWPEQRFAYRAAANVHVATLVGSQCGGRGRVQELI